jgi:hypothetical protein
MRIHTNGNIGIGTSTPGQKLEVAGNIVVTGTGLFNNDLTISKQTPRIFFSGTGSSIKSYQVQPDLAVFGDFGIRSTTDGVNIWRYTPADTTHNFIGNAYVSGNVGIGTTGPAAKLDVAGTINFDSTVWTTVGTADITGLVADTWYDIDEWDWNAYGTFMLKVYMFNQDAGNGYQQTSIALFTLQGVNTTYAGVHSNEEIMNTVSHTQSPVTVTARFYCNGGAAMHLQIKMSYVNAAAISNGLTIYTRKF